MICQSDSIYVVSHLLFIFVFIFMDGAWEMVNKSSWMWEIFLGAQKRGSISRCSCFDNGFNLNFEI